MILTDEALLLRYALERTPANFDEIVERFGPALNGYLNKILGDRQMAEDALQGTFLQVHLNADAFEDGRLARPWLFTIAKRQAIDLFRRNRRHVVNHVSLSRGNRSPWTPDDSDNGSGDLLAETVAGKEPTPVERLIKGEEKESLMAALENVPQLQSEVVRLVHLDGLSHGEAAAKIGVPVGTVKSRASSGRKALRKLTAA